MVETLATDNSRVRLVLHDRPGPTTKADCLNRLYRALIEEEATGQWGARMVVLHDAEDLVDPAALALLDQAIESADLVQLSVRPEPQASWVGSHYCEEFAEAHAKSMVVRQALGAGLPSAGVGCAISREALERLALKRGTGEPFAADCLTEDYELGLGLRDMGFKTRFLRVRDDDGNLVATRACFPATLKEAVRQKTRWIHGISLQSWDRMGWSSSPAEFWMRLRDRRGPFAALVLVAGYLLLFLVAIVELAVVIWPDETGESLALSLWLVALLWINLGSFVWRAVFRFAFTAREYGVEQGLRAVLRIPLANIVAIMAGRRAFTAYLGTLRGVPVVWDKTEHHAHPASARLKRNTE